MPETLGRNIRLFFLSMLLGACSAEAADIQFRPDAKARGSLVLLGDVAQVSDPDEGKAAALRRLELFPAPGSSETRLVRTTAIRQLLELHGVGAQHHCFTGATLIRITWTSDTDTPAKKAEITQEEEQFVFSKRAIVQGEILREADVELRPLAKLPTGFSGCAKPEAVIGQEALRAIGANQALDSRWLRRPLLVERGQTIAVIARGAGVRARTTARALESGAQGDLILVESLDTKQKYSVTVTDHQQVEVLTGGNVTRRMTVR